MATHPAGTFLNARHDVVARSLRRPPEREPGPVIGPAPTRSRRERVDAGPLSGGPAPFSPSAGRCAPGRRT